MPEIIDIAFSARVENGPIIAFSNSLEVAAYDKLEVSISSEWWSDHDSMNTGHNDTSGLARSWEKRTWRRDRPHGHLHNQRIGPDRDLLCILASASRPFENPIRKLGRIPV